MRSCGPGTDGICDGESRRFFGDCRGGVEPDSTRWLSLSFTRPHQAGAPRCRRLVASAVGAPAVSGRLLTGT
jgi:hypothetical protein